MANRYHRDRSPMDPLEPQNKLLEIVSRRFTPEELSHLSVGATADGQGVTLRWHKHRPAPVCIPALQLLAVTGHATAASLPPQEESEVGDEDSQMSDSFSRGQREADDGDEEDVKTVRGEDDRGSRTPTNAPQATTYHRHPTEPLEGHYDPSVLTRGQSVDADAVNTAHAAHAYPSLVAQCDAQRDEWRRAMNAGVFNGVRNPPAPAEMPAVNMGPNMQNNAHTAHAPHNYACNPQVPQNVVPHPQATGDHPYTYNPQPLQPQEPQQQYQQQYQQPYPQQFPPPAGEGVMHRATTAGPSGQNSQRPPVSRDKGKGRDMGDGPGNGRWRSQVDWDT